MHIPKSILKDRVKVKTGRKRRWDGKDDRKMESIRRPLGISCRGDTHIIRYQPIRDFLRSRSGRPWDNIWAEICKVYDRRSFIGYAVRTRIRKLIEEYGTVDEDGRLMNERGGRIPGWFVDSFYVRGDGRLIHEQSNRLKSPIKESPIVEIDEKKFYRHKGVWYEVETSSYIGGLYARPQRDVFLYKTEKWKHGNTWDRETLLMRKYKRTIYCTKKRPLSKKEKKRYKLK